MRASEVDAVVAFPGARMRRVAIALFAGTISVVAVVMVSSVPVAMAARGHVFERSIGSAGTGAGQMSLVEPQFSESGFETSAGSGVAVDPGTGDVYVADTGNHRVDVFAPDGEFVRAFGFGVLDGATEPQVCTITCRQGLSGSSPGELESPVYIAVSVAGGEEAVYVGDTGDSIVTRYGTSGKLDSSFGNGEAGEPNGQLVGPPAEVRPGERFSPLLGLATDPAGGLWVEDSGGERFFEPSVFKFGAAGGFEQVAWKESGTPASFAVNGEAVYIPLGGEASLGKFDLAGDRLGVLFSPGNELAGTFGGTAPNINGEITGLALDGGSLYLDGGRSLLSIPASCSTRGPGCKASEPLEVLESPALDGGAGVAADTAEHTLFVAGTADDQIAEFILEPQAVPQIGSQWSEEVTSGGAELHAEVKPRSLSGLADYYFEYGPCSSVLSCPSSPYPDRTVTGTLPAGFDFESAQASIVGLQSGTIYHFRVVAENSEGGVEGASRGEESTFATTGEPTGDGLIDGRGWEQVSPVNKRGALIEPIEEEGVSQAAEDGAAVVYHADQPTEPDAEGALNQVEILSRRTPRGWVSKGIEPPHGVTGKPEGEGEVYRAFAQNLQSGVLQPPGAFDQALSPEASALTATVRTLRTPSGGMCESGQACFRPLVTGKPGFANVPPGTNFGGTVAFSHVSSCPQAGPFCGPRFEGATADDSSVVVSSYAQLTSVAVPPSASETGELYRWNAGILSLVSILPAEGGGEGAPAPEGAVLGAPNSGTGYSTDARNAISADGERIFWTATVAGERHLYVRDLALGQTLQLDVVQGGGEGSVDPAFQIASTDGSRVLFTDRQALTSSSVPTGNGSGDLYECEIAVSAGALTCDLTDLTPRNEQGEGVEVAGPVIGMGGSQCSSQAAAHAQLDCYVYFAAAKKITGAGARAAEGSCEQEHATALCNLYVWHDGTIGLVAVLSGEDSPDWANGETFSVAEDTARVSENGRYLAFMSSRSLTGRDMHDREDGSPDQQVFEYDALEGSLACVSCLGSGARAAGQPVVTSDRTGEPERVAPYVNGSAAWKVNSTRLAANVPTWTPYALFRATYQSRYVSDDGQVIFNDYDGLVPGDVNGTWDVYEYEPDGVGSCSGAAASRDVAWRPARAYDGLAGSGSEPASCVGLLSSGSSNIESAFLDASRSGEDVFFLTTGQLSQSDEDHTYDIYDAHVCSGTSPCIAATGPGATPSCESAEACQRPAAHPETSAAPASATTLGPGNVPPRTRARWRAKMLKKALAACRRSGGHARSKRIACEKRARKRYGRATGGKK